MTNHTWTNGTLLFAHRQRLLPVTDVLATVEISTDLETWNSGAAFTTILETNPGNDGVTVVHGVNQEAIKASRNLFMRLKVELADP